MRKLIFLLILSFFCSFASSANSDEISQIQVKIDSLEDIVTKLNDKIVSLNQRIIYQDLFTEINIIRSDTKFLTQQLKNTRTDIIIFETNKFPKKKYKPTATETIQLYKDAIDLNNKAIENWKNKLDLFISLGLIDQENADLLENRYTAVLAERIILTANLNKAENMINN